MKTTLLILAAVAANSAAFAGDLSLVERSTGHGQAIPLYASAQSAPKVSVALYKAGRAAGTIAKAQSERAEQIQAVSRDTGHGQASVQFVRF